MGDLRLTAVWQRPDEKVIDDVITFWQTLKALPPNVDSRSRAKELCVVAYLDSEVVGVSTVALDILPQLRCRFGFFRCLVAPEYRRQELARKLAVMSRRVLAEWSEKNPNERVLGMAAIIESSKLDEFSKAPVWSASGLTLIGYTAEGRQIRVTWFEHGRLG